MWPFKYRYSLHIQTLAPLLDTAFTNTARALINMEREKFVAHLRDDDNIDEVDESHPSGNRIYWRDRWLLDFTFSVDYGSYLGSSPQWGLFAQGGSNNTKPSFFGIMLIGSGPDVGHPQGVGKCVAIIERTLLGERATYASTVLAGLLSAKYGYRHLE